MPNKKIKGGDLIIDSPWGQYKLDVMVPAESRAMFYAKQLNYECDSKEWGDEIQYALQDNAYEAIHWLLNNMEWGEIYDKAVELNDQANVSEKDFWTTADHIKFVEKTD